MRPSEDLQRAVERNRDAILARHPWLNEEPLIQAVRTALTENAGARSKSRKVIALMDAASRAMAPNTPCAKGCDACCHIPTAIFETEAKAIAAATGRAMAVVQRRPLDEVPGLIAHFFRTPCPFLVEHACSIYEIRPAACRQHHTINPDASQCAPGLEPSETSVSKLRSVMYIEGAFSYLHHQEVAGDIREFFPAPA